MRLWSEPTDANQLEAMQMKLWILAAVLAVALVGGAAVAVAPDDGDTSDGTVAVDMLDTDSAFVVLIIDADTAHQAQYELVDRSSGVPVFANATLNEPADDFEPRLSQHSGKSLACDKQTTCEQCHVRLALAPHLYPLLC